MCLCTGTFRDLGSGLSKTKCQDLKGGERSLRRPTSGETLVEAPSGADVQTVQKNFDIGAKD